MGLRAAAIHTHTNTTIYIDSSGVKETNTILKARLSSIHIALDTFINSSWMGILSDSFSSLQAIQHELHHPNNSEYNHHGPLIEVKVVTILDREQRGLPTVVRKVRAHTKVLGNKLAKAENRISVIFFRDIYRDNIGIDIIDDAF